jgi:hypothetical protein
MHTFNVEWVNELRTSRKCMAGLGSQDIPDKGVLGAMGLILAFEQSSLISAPKGYVHWPKGIMNAFFVLEMQNLENVLGN